MIIVIFVFLIKIFLWILLCCIILNVITAILNSFMSDLNCTKCNSFIRQEYIPWFTKEECLSCKEENRRKLLTPAQRQQEDEDNTMIYDNSLKGFRTKTLHDYSYLNQ